jgi:hypothetical protein
MDININLDKPIKEQEEEKAEDITKDVPLFNIIEYELNGKLYRMDVSPLLQISNAGLESATDAEIDEHLEKIAAYRHSIAALKEAINTQFIKSQEAFDKWQSSKWVETNRIALLRRKNLKEETASQGGWFGSITKEELKGILLSEFSNEYVDHDLPVVKYRTMDRVIGNLLKILEDRGSQIQTIVRRRQGLRRDV